MTLVVTLDAVPEVIETTGGQIIEGISVTEVFEVTTSGPDVLTETLTDTQVVITDQTSIVTEQWVTAEIIESAAQGPRGPIGAASTSYPAKRLIYTDGVLTEVRLYSDSAATTLAETRTILRLGAVVNEIRFYDSLGVLTKTRTFEYNLDGALTGVTDQTY
jgi:hypothetical protein